MAWDILNFDDRTAYVQDTDILMLRHFLLRTLSGITPNDLGTDDGTCSELQRYIESWEWSGSGIIAGVDFDRNLKPFANRIRPMLKLLQLTSDSLDEFGTDVPRDYLGAHINRPAFGYTRLRIDDMQNVIGRFCSVIAPADVVNGAE